MSQTYEFYAERAKAAAAEARAAKLDNVRSRALRARDSWLGLAAQARAVANQRARAARDKATGANEGTTAARIA